MISLPVGYISMENRGERYLTVSYIEKNPVIPYPETPCPSICDEFGAAVLSRINAVLVDMNAEFLYLLQYSSLDRFIKLLQSLLKSLRVGYFIGAHL